PSGEPASAVVASTRPESDDDASRIPASGVAPSPTETSGFEPSGSAASGPDSDFDASISPASGIPGFDASCCGGGPPPSSGDPGRRASGRLRGGRASGARPGAL